MLVMGSSLLNWSPPPTPSHNKLFCFYKFFLWDYLALMLLLASSFSSPSLLICSNHSVSSMPLEHSPSPPQSSEATSDNFLFVTSLLSSYYKLISFYVNFSLGIRGCSHIMSAAGGGEGSKPEDDDC